MTKTNFNCLNIVEEYTYNINNVNIADKLIKNFRFGHWISYKKWWLPMIFGAFKRFYQNCTLFIRNIIFHINST